MKASIFNHKLTEEKQRSGKSRLDVVDEASAESGVSVAELVLQGFRRALLDQTD